MTPAGPTQPFRTSVRSVRQWRLWLSGLFGSRYDGLAHFAVVEPGVLMRCGQPHVRDLERIRQEHGLRCVFVARGGTRHPLRGRWFRLERRWCDQHDVRLVHAPFSDHAPPPPDVFDRFVSLARDPASRPLLVHCEQGFHRTGVLVAAFRLALSGWTVEQALAEMAAHGFEADSAKRRPLHDALLAWAAARQPGPASRR